MVEIAARCEGQEITVSVSDRGDGVPHDELDRIFEKFIQSTTTKTGAGGTGLGLSICKQIIEQHQGKIWAENRDGTGARFTFTVPWSETCAPSTPKKTRRRLDPHA